MWIDDLVFKQCHQPLTVVSWIPEDPLVILGRGNDRESECLPAHCEKDGVPILRRRGGGGAVVLHSGCVIVSVGTWVSHYYKSGTYFRLINQALINTLAHQWPELTALQQEGISDLTFEKRKVAGTSLFRSRNYLLYQASLLVDTQLPLIDRYLKHPSREPDYRQGKSHRDFLSSLSVFNSSITCEQIRSLMQSTLSTHLFHQLKDELVDPVPEQIPHVRNRQAPI